MLELRINELEKVMATARIIDESQIDTSKVVLLSAVKIKNMKTKKEVQYKLVSETEANLKEGKISATSPIGQGLLGKAVGEVAEVQTPAGLMQFQILEISV